MMRKSKAFRPASAEALEDRSVPTAFGGALGGLIASVPAQDARAVQQAFQAFERAYVNDVRNILFKAGTTPASQQSAFNTQVGIDLGTLNGAIAKDIQNLSGTNPNLAAQVSGELLGTDPNATLQGELANLSLPSGTGPRAMAQYLHSGLRDVVSTESQVVRQVRSATPPAGAISPSTLRTSLQGVATAFRNFNQAYANAVATNLTSVGKNTAIPSANQTAFRSAVTAAVQQLNTDVQSAVGPLTTSIPTLSTTLSNDLLGTTPPATPDNSFLGRLNRMTLPSSTNLYPMLVFRFNSIANVVRANAVVVHDITAAVNQFNSTTT